MNPVERGARALDDAQRRHRGLAFGVAVVKKMGDDDAGRMAALMAYYGFFSLFPLLLVLVSVLGFVLDGNPDLRARIVDSALGQFPVIGPSLASGARLQGLRGSLPSIVIGLATALWAGLGAAQSGQVAMNTIWNVPRAQWPNFVFRRVRALALLAVLGPLSIASTFLSGFATSGALPYPWPPVAWVGALALNVVLFGLAYLLLTARSLRWREVAPGACVAALSWTLLLNLGGFYVSRQLSTANDVYGTFALVIALLVWLSLGGQIALIGAEINVVRAERLWPRSLVQPPINEGDERVYSAIVERARMRPEVAVRVWFTKNRDKYARGRSGGEPPVPDPASSGAPRPPDHDGETAP